MALYLTIMAMILYLQLLGQLAEGRWWVRVSQCDVRGYLIATTHILRPMESWPIQTSKEKMHSGSQINENIFTFNLQPPKLGYQLRIPQEKMNCGPFPRKNKGTGPVKKKKIDCLCVVSGDGLVGVTWDPLGRRRFGKGATDDGRNKVTYIFLVFHSAALQFSFPSWQLSPCTSLLSPFHI